MSGAQTQTPLASYVYYEMCPQSICRYRGHKQMCILCNYFRSAHRATLESHFMGFVYIYKTYTEENKLSVLITFNIL